MTSYVVTPLPRPSVAVDGEAGRFPVQRIYCVGFNYAEHTVEIVKDTAKTPPVLFAKASDTLLADGQELPYPPKTADLHYEVELVVAIGTGGAQIRADRALDHVYGYAVGNDFTRRDLQNHARAHGQPWETAKTFEGASGIGAIYATPMVGHLTRGRIWLSVNGVVRQDSDLSQMIWSVPDIIAEMSSYFRLQPGDLIYTGTPAGVGALSVGDVVVAGIDSLGTLTHRVV